MSFLETEEGIKWLRDVHIPDLPQWVRYATIRGNEDCPNEIEVYESNHITNGQALWYRHNYDTEKLVIIRVRDKDGIWFPPC